MAKAYLLRISSQYPVYTTIVTVILANVDQIHLYLLNEVVNVRLTVVVHTYDADLLPASTVIP